ncbi:unnamed protein product [Brassicogethes aeneus]|uniref:Ubiquilin-1 n=1 Tax=Brassicogethes aeneus TaxID=1431903 RepID=A0A9P0FBB0_BRAAE|nr:unnamed protein product [Brassicogethes aeneus]
MTDDVKIGEEIVEKNNESAGSISITVKTQKKSETFQVTEDMQICSFKEILAGKFEADIEQLCLIFAGKIMKDNDTLKKHNLKDGLTVHLIIKEKSSENENNTVPPRPSYTNTPFNLPNPGNLSSPESLENFMELQRQMESELLSNPNLMNEILNPEYMRAIFGSNPQLQELFERNPELNHMINNPEILRQTLEISRNPALLQEMMRSNDRAMSNLESIPGGFSALERMYREIQEPMLSATDGIARNPFSGLQGNNDASENPQQGSENVDPLPNPWAGLRASTSEERANIRSRLEANAPALQEQIRTMMPQLLQALQNINANNPNNPNTNTNNENPTPNPNQNSNPNSTNSNPNSTFESAFSEFLSRMSAQNESFATPELLYGVQLQQLEIMGFTNREANLEALTASFGDINAAIQKLVDSD